MDDALDPLYDASPQHHFLLGGLHPLRKVLYLVVEPDDVGRVDLGLPRSVRVGEEGSQEVAAVLGGLVRPLPFAVALVAVVVVGT